MSPITRKGILAIAAVLDIAVHSRGRRVSAKELAARQKLPARHLEPVLQALVRDGILKGTRGPCGGYSIARDQTEITAEDILRSSKRVDVLDASSPQSELVGSVIQPVMADAERSFLAALRDISLADLMRRIANTAPAQLLLLALAEIAM